jgi:arylsulfatase A-like enzyme
MDTARAVNRRSRLHPGSAALLALACLCAACGKAHEGKPRPNVLLIVIDTLRADRLPFHGYEHDTAPFLTGLAESGVVFESAWSSSSWTAPATASIFTSLYPIQHGVTMGMHAYKTEKEREGSDTLLLNRIPEEVETIPSFLASLGYRTFAVSDNPNVSDKLGFERGFERIEVSDYEGAPHVNAVLESWIDEIRAASPWFVYLHYMDPHKPYFERQPFYREPKEDLPLPRVMARYDSEIRYLDDHIAQAFELLGAGQGTLVLLTADHGEELGDHGQIGHFFQLYSELIHVPLVIREPGVEPVRRRPSAGVSVVDLLPTLRDILGEPPSAQDAGVSLRPHYLEDHTPEERTFFAMRTSSMPNLESEKIAVVQGRYKLIHTSHSDRVELYDLEADPDERTNLAKSDPQLAARLLESWHTFMTSAPRWDGATTTIELDEAQLEALRKLGYAGDEGSE